MRDPNRYPLVLLVPGVAFNLHKFRWYLFSGAWVVFAIAFTMFYWGHFYGFKLFVCWSVEQRLSMCALVSLIILNLPVVQRLGDYGLIACAGQFVIVHLVFIAYYTRHVSMTRYPSRNNPEERLAKIKNTVRRAAPTFLNSVACLAASVGILYYGFFVWEDTAIAAARYWTFLAAANWITHTNIIIFLPAIMPKVEQLSKAEMIELETLTRDYAYKEEEFVT